jgi:hypothetical protein
MKQIIFSLLCLVSFSALADDTLHCDLPGNFWRQYILHEDSTFTFRYELTMGGGYSKGTYSHVGDDYIFEFDKVYTVHDLNQSSSGDQDSVYVECNTTQEIFVNVADSVYRGYNKVAVPKGDGSPILFQVGNEAVWLRDQEKGNHYTIELKSPEGEYYLPNMDRVVLNEYREGFYKITDYSIFFAAKLRPIAHRMKRVDYIMRK